MRRRDGATGLGDAVQALLGAGLVAIAAALLVAWLVSLAGAPPIAQSAAGLGVAGAATLADARRRRG